MEILPVYFHIPPPKNKGLNASNMDTPMEEIQYSTRLSNGWYLRLGGRDELSNVVHVSVV